MFFGLHAVPSLWSRSPSFQLTISSHPFPSRAHHRLLQKTRRDALQGGVKPPHSKTRTRRAGVGSGALKFEQISLKRARRWRYPSSRDPESQISNVRNLESLGL